MLKVIARIGYYQKGKMEYVSEDSFSIPEWKETPELIEFIKSQNIKRADINHRKSYADSWRAECYFDMTDENGKAHFHDRAALSNLAANLINVRATTAESC